jgi:hypothetical protein
MAPADDKPPPTTPPPGDAGDPNASPPPPPVTLDTPGAYGFDAHPASLHIRGKREGVTWEASADMRLSYIARIPEMRISDDVAGIRSFSTGTHVHGTTALTTGGVGFDFGVVIDDRWRLGGVGGAYESSIGTSSRRAATVNGSIAEMRPWTASRFSFDFGGVGQRFKYRRWQAGWFVWGSVMLTTMNLSIAEGAGSTDASASAVAVAFHAQLEVCRRIDLEARVCAAVAPDVFDGGYWLPGGTVAARWEWGR